MTKEERTEHLDAIAKSLHKKVNLLKKIHVEVRHEEILFPGWDTNVINSSEIIAREKIQTAAKTILAEGLSSDEGSLATIDELLELIDYIASMIEPWPTKTETSK